MRRALVFAAFVLTLGAAAVRAQNLVANPHFSTGSVSPWNGFGLVFDSTRDATGDGVGSGPSTIGYNQGSYGVYQPCIGGISAGEQFSFGGKILYPAASSGSSAGYRVQWFSGPNCDTFLSDAGTTRPDAGTSPIGSWMALSETATAPPGAQSLLFVGDIFNAQAPPFKVNYDDIFLYPVCTRNATTGCLVGGRFQVTVDYTSQNSGSGAAQVMQFNGQRAEDDESVFWWFFSPTNFEMGLKILNGCPVNQHFWVFISGLTNQGWTVHIKDTQTGTIASTSNPIGRLTPTIAATVSPLTCP